MDKEKAFTNDVIHLAQRCISWHAARSGGGVTVTTETSGLTLGAALTIRRCARAAGVWPEASS